MGSGTIRNEVALLPEFTLAGVTLRNVPIHMERPSEGNTQPPRGTLCMDALSRFTAPFRTSR